MKLLSDMGDPEKLEELWRSLSPEMRRFLGLHPKKSSGRKRDPDTSTRFMEIVRLRRSGATWPEIERAMRARFGWAAEGTYRRQYERELRELRNFASKESDEEFLAILERMKRNPGRPRKKNPDKTPS